METLFTQIQSSIDLTMALSNFQRCSLLRPGWGSPEAPAPSPTPLELSLTSLEPSIHWGRESKRPHDLLVWGWGKQGGSYHLLCLGFLDLLTPAAPSCCSLAIQSKVHRPVAVASPRSLLEMQNFGVRLVLLNQNLHLKRSSGGFYVH